MAKVVVALVLLHRFLILERCIADRPPLMKYHPGQQPLKVVRLHRFDHSDVESFLEAEERWQTEDYTAPARASSFLQQPTVPRVETRSYVQMSAQQTHALGEHHRHHRNRYQSASLLEMADSENATHQQQANVFQYTSLDTGGSSDPTLTSLISVGSQYMGPIGVGTRRVPQSCKTDSGSELVFYSDDERNSAEGNSTALLPQCFLEAQTVINTIFDTGSTNIWMNSDLCDGGGMPCNKEGSTQYNHLTSETFQEPNKSRFLNVGFGAGRITGYMGIDDFHIGPFTVHNQSFGMMKTMEGKLLQKISVDGILGLAFPKMSAGGVVPLIDNLINQNVMPIPEFAFYFNPNDKAGNAILWGGVDEEFYEGPITFFPVVEEYFWAIAMPTFKIGEEVYVGKNGIVTDTSAWEAPKTFKAIVDTGTTMFTAFGPLFDKIMARLQPCKCDEMTDRSHPPITFTVMSDEPVDLVFEKHEYMTGSAEQGMCWPAFMSLQIPAAHGPGMAFGDVFIRKYFTVFSRRPEGSAVGFAEAKNGVATDQHIKVLTKYQTFAGHHDSLPSKKAENENETSAQKAEEKKNAAVKNAEGDKKEAAARKADEKKKAAAQAAEEKRKAAEQEAEEREKSEKEEVAQQAWRGAVARKKSENEKEAAAQKAEKDKKAAAQKAEAHARRVWCGIALVFAIILTSVASAHYVLSRHGGMGVPEKKSGARS